MTKSAFIGVFAIKIFLLASIGVPLSAEASLLSAVVGFFGNQTAVAEVSDTVNSQKMPLLEAPINSDITAGSSLFAVADVKTALIDEAPARTANNATTSNKISTYKVKSGDTLTGIAQKFDISLSTILWANNLNRTSKLSIGQQLIILPIDGVQHKVASGDTLQGITLKYKADIDEVMAFNDLLKTDVIKIGDIILVPDGEMVAKAAPQPAAKPIVASVKTLASVATGISIAKADTASIANSGYFMRPISGGTKTQGLHGSNGVDLADACGTPIYASAGGTVEVAKNSGYNGGYGDYVVLSHPNGSQTLYAHMNKISVSEGGSVNKGDVIGTVGATGKVYGATGCHVHFELRGAGIANPF